MERINIGGKERPIEFGWNGMRIFCREAKIPLAKIDRLGDDMTPDDVTILLYAGLRHGAEREKEKVEFTVDDVGEWINDDMTVIAKAMQIFQEQMPKLKNPEAPGKGAT
jgi:hypothetical protein